MNIKKFNIYTQCSFPRKQTHQTLSERGFFMDLCTLVECQMVNAKIKLIIFLGAKDGEAPYSQQKQDQKLTVAQIMPNST